jgi:hypothetical protein
MSNRKIPPTIKKFLKTSKKVRKVDIGKVKVVKKLSHGLHVGKVANVIVFCKDDKK